ncbi:hypothetical protein MRB53_038240 [Persea americana]|nr:hypothetical protein MRB53_038240 [Persea americana]
MAPARKARSSTGAAQPTLNFRNTKPVSSTSRVTKSTSDKPSKTSPAKVKEITSAAEIEAPVSAVLNVPEPKPAEPEADELTIAARKVSKTQVNKYWAEKESERKAPRVHQQGLTVHEKVLREFDMNSRFGPSVGITREARWRRAHKLKMNPPIEVLAAVTKEADEAKKSKSAKSTVEERTSKWQRSIVDELMASSRGTGIELHMPYSSPSLCLSFSGRKYQSQKRHATEQTILHLSEVRRSLVKVDLFLHLRISRQRVHNDRCLLNLP